ncbi:hypothetical protein ASZ90_003878 [hydrocarbon metagenome]|uniref:Uncharacterized protein n=1 Tax=hydrocarbon metagenome TaxID=938273 RepID=A0A0W8FZN8_9ZZZZ
MRNFAGKAILPFASIEYLKLPTNINFKFDVWDNSTFFPTHPQNNAFHVVKSRTFSTKIRVFDSANFL